MVFLPSVRFMCGGGGVAVCFFGLYFLLLVFPGFGGGFSVGTVF